MPARRCLGGINDGAGLTVYFGHSSTDQWGSEGLLTTADAAGLTNTDDPTIVVQFGCWNTYFSEPTLQSLGTALSTSAGGAAAVVGATTLTNSVHDAMFGPIHHGCVLLGNYSRRRNDRREARPRQHDHRRSTSRWDGPCWATRPPPSAKAR